MMMRRPGDDASGRAEAVRDRLGVVPRPVVVLTDPASAGTRGSPSTARTGSRTGTAATTPRSPRPARIRRSSAIAFTDRRSHPFWKTSTIRPYAAPTDSRFITIALTGTTSERNTTVSRMNESASTSARTIGLYCVRDVEEVLDERALTTDEHGRPAPCERRRHVLGAQLPDGIGSRLALRVHGLPGERDLHAERRCRPDSPGVRRESRATGRPRSDRRTHRSRSAPRARSTSSAWITSCAGRVDAAVGEVHDERVERLLRLVSSGKVPIPASPCLMPRPSSSGMTSWKK